MPIKEATFWIGITVFGTGLYGWMEGGDRVPYAIALTVLGLLATLYAIVAHDRPQLPKMPIWIGLLLLTWSAIGYDIYDRHHPKLITVVPLAPTAQTSPDAGQIRHSSPSGLPYVWIPAGNFEMGCSPKDKECNCPAGAKNCRMEEAPLHPVTITKGFWIGQTEVTVGAYKQMKRQLPDSPDYNPSWTDDKLPMVNVTWFDAVEFCRWDNGELPWEAQWEYAARGKSTVPRYGDIDDIAWYSGNSLDRPHEVGLLKAPNWIGLYDMLGNVWEWVDDWYDASYYSSSPTIDPHLENALGKEGERDERVLRGGSNKVGPELTRFTNRNRDLPEKHSFWRGFRCVQNN